MTDNTQAASAQAWLSCGLESLVARFPHIDPGSDRQPGAGNDVDLVIVGSGYGAAVAAHQLAGCRPVGQPDARPLSICVLERGSEYLAGAFPSRMADVAGHVRFSSAAQTTPRGQRSGLFDLRLGGDVMALVANGVGGGSLINAGVMLEPLDAVWTGPHWPEALREGVGLKPHFKAVRPWLGAEFQGRPNTVDSTGASPLCKTVALKRLGGRDRQGRPLAQAVPITVALQPDTTTVAGVPLSPCIGCGDCATGCNHGAKHSLDVGLLARACRTEGVALYSGATVLWLEKQADGAGWTVLVQHTDDKLRLRQGPPFRLRAQRVILAAGTLGSTEILLRSSNASRPQAGLALSAMRGQRFATNGDQIASVHGTAQAVNAVADEDTAAATRGVGPTITAMIDLRDQAEPFVVQDLAVPGPLRQAFAELFTTAGVLHALPERDCQNHAASDADPCAVDARVIASSLPVAIIGHDTSGGRLSLLGGLDRPPLAPLTTTPQPLAADEGDGALCIHWPGLSDAPPFAARHAQLQRRLQQQGLGGRLLPNPVWQLLPAKLQVGLKVPRGPMLTVHPLGGCAMADDVHRGVVNHLGQVFDAGAATGAVTGAVAGAATGAVHAGLVVLDGSIVPTSLGINPALTIAALAHRATAGLRCAWTLDEPRPHLAPLGPRPRFRDLPSQTPPPPLPTEIELVERMRGPARLADGRTVCIELTLYSQPTALRSLMQAAPARRLVLDAQRSQLRVFVGDPAAAWDDEPAEDSLLLKAGLSGTLSIFQREATQALPRTVGALGDWFINRGLRDLAQKFDDTLHGREKPASLADTVCETLALASRAGSVRRLDYDLTVQGATYALAGLFADGTPLTGQKRLRYSLAASPIQQLMDMRLTRCPGLAPGAAPVLSLHLPFLAAQAVPLLRVVAQQDQPTALGDMAAFAAYVARILIDGHLWSFRKPDAANPRQPQRLPGAVPGAPQPKVVELEVARLPLDQASPALRARLPSDADDHALPVNIRLTRYCPPRPDAALPPVLLIHGYSASGTTFAHPSLQPGLMRFLCDRHRRDVWVLDLRSSCGMPTAEHPWAFEDMGCEDIPLAVDHVCQATGVEQVDIVAHCMGVAMLFMGLLGENQFGGPTLPGNAPNLLLPRLGARHEALRHRLWDRDLTDWHGIDNEDFPAPAPQGPPHDSPKPPAPFKSRIRRLVMSQVGPTVLLTPANIARSYLMRYVQQFVAAGQYQFRQTGQPGLVDQLLDRLLAAMPYPPVEFQLENPFWPPGQRLPWVGSRHRIDALFGRVFNLAQMGDDALDHIDDFFGPFNVDTVSQVMYFARYRMVTDRSGFNRFVDPGRMRQRLTFPMLSLHARQNGLADAGTRQLMEQVVAPHVGAGGSLRSEYLPGDTLGHQDSLIGQRTATLPVYQRIGDFLQQQP